MEPRTLSMIIVSAVLAILSFVATVLRLVARSKSRMRYGLDDYLIVAGLVSMAATALDLATKARLGSRLGGLHLQHYRRCGSQGWDVDGSGN